MEGDATAAGASAPPRRGTKRMRGSTTATEDVVQLQQSPVTHDKDRRDLIVRKARQLAFPDDQGPYNRSALRKQYGRDTPLGGGDGLISYHKGRLDRFLNDLLLRHRWQEAAGILSVLLRALPTEEGWKPRNSRQFWAAMEATRQLEGLQGNDSEFRKMYQVLYNKQPKYLHQRDRVQEGAVRLEQALYLMGQRQYEDAQLASRPLMDTPPYRDHAVANMIHGLVLYHQWYDSVMQELQDFERRGNVPFKNEKLELTEGVGESEAVIGHNCTHESVYTTQNFMPRPDDDLTSEASAPFSEENVLTSSRRRLHESTLLDEGKRPIQSFYDDSDEERETSWVKKAAIICTCDMNKKLFPFNLPKTHQGEHYAVPMVTTKVKGLHSNAIKHLRKTLSLDKRLTMALLPLVQLMLGGADIGGAYEEIEKCCQESDQCVPFRSASDVNVYSCRIKGMLLESLTPKYTEMLTQCYEDILQRDPTSEQSIKALIDLHENGACRTAALFECIACYLDGSTGSFVAWRKMVSCFEQLKEAEEEFSKVQDQVHGDLNEEINVKESSYKPLEFLLGEHVQKAWDSRAKWWPLKHFNTECICQELQLKGGCKQIVYKAACAAHIFSPSISYVLEVQKYLEALGGYQHLAKLHKHTANSFNLLARLRSCMDLTHQE